MAYTPTTWVNDVTALNATRMNNIETGVDNTDQALTDHLADTTDAHDASAISVADAGSNFSGTDVEAVLAELSDAATISVADTGGNYTSNNVEDVLDEIAGALGGGPGIGGGTELDYVAFTSDVNITATTEATGNTIVTSSSISLDGTTTVMIEFFCPSIETDSGGDRGAMIDLWDSLNGGSAAVLGQIGRHRVQTTGTGGGVTNSSHSSRVRLTPASGDHVYSIRAWSDTSGGTQVAHGASGGTGAFFPGFIRVITVG